MGVSSVYLALGVWFVPKTRKRKNLCWVCQSMDMRFRPWRPLQGTSLRPGGCLLGRFLQVPKAAHGPTRSANSALLWRTSTRLHFRQTVSGRLVTSTFCFLLFTPCSVSHTLLTSWGAIHRRRVTVFPCCHLFLTIFLSPLNNSQFHPQNVSPPGWIFAFSFFPFIEPTEQWHVFTPKITVSKLLLKF